MAAGDTTVYFIARDAMLMLVEASPLLAMGLLREISSRLREFNAQYIQEVLQTERLAIVGRFARSIVHDLKNPLNIISITAEMVSEEKDTPEARRLAKSRISGQVDRISDLVNEIRRSPPARTTPLWPRRRNMTSSCSNSWLKSNLKSN